MAKKARADCVVGVLSTSTGQQKVILTRGINPPSLLCLDKNTKDTLAYFLKLRRRTRSSVGGMSIPRSKHKGSIRRLGSYSDFTKISDISPAAALVLAAEHDRAVRGQRVKPAAVDIAKWDPKVFSILYDLGFFKVLGFTESQLTAIDLPTREGSSEIVVMPMQSGSNVKLDAAGDAIVGLIERVGGSDELRVQLWGAIVDAVENVRDHAYRSGTEIAFTLNKIPHLWWAIGAANTKTRKLTLAIYDQGLTIPYTLPYNWSRDASIKESFLKIIGFDWNNKELSNDHLAIRAAIRMSNTSTNQDNRGKGLARIYEVVSKCKGGVFRIVSRHGEYIFRDGSENYKYLDIPLSGTLLEIEATF